jgi:hypothetical protein
VLGAGGLLVSICRHDPARGLAVHGAAQCAHRRLAMDGRGAHGLLCLAAVDICSLLLSLHLV